VALGETVEHDRRSTLPALLDLSLVRNSIVSSFYCSLGERHANAELPNAEVVSGYQQAITLASLGDDSGTDGCQRMRDAIVSCLPTESQALLKRLAYGAPNAPFVNLEIRVHDCALENYPWELLAEPGLLAPLGADVAVWRSVAEEPGVAGERSVARELPRRRQASTAVLLVGSASFDDSRPPFAREEVIHLARLLGQYRWVKPLPYPSITFGDFSETLSVIHPAIVHVVVHGSTDGFRWQDPGTLPESHHTIPAQELAGRLSRSTASVAVLNACDSATASEDSSPIARHISEEAGTSTIGMAAELPASIGIAFAENFYRTLAVGSTIIEAHSHAVRSIRTTSRFANLWSVPIMYSSDPNVVIFPANPRARARLSFDEVGDHLAKIEAEIGTTADHRGWAPGTWAENTAASPVRIRYVRNVIATLPRLLNEQPGDLFYALDLRNGCDDLERSLEDVSSCLRRLKDSSSSYRERACAVDALAERLKIIRQTRQRINQLFVEMP
jgi:CHAT domain